MRSLRPRAILLGATQTSDAVSIRNLCLPTRSVLNRLPEDAEQASAAMKSFRYRFPAGGMRTWCIFSCLVSESPVMPTVIALCAAVCWGCRRTPCASLWSENAIVFGRWSGQDLAGQILYLLKPAHCVGGLGDGCCGGKRSNFRDPVG